MVPLEPAKQKSHTEDGQIDIGKRCAAAFSTPIVSYPWPDSEAVNEELKAEILHREEHSEGINRSNIGGWHSNTDFFTWDCEGARTLKRRVEQMTLALTKATMTKQHGKHTFNYSLSGWANVNRHGSYNNVHNHPNCLWSGAYYVASGEPEADKPQNGKLELLDPRAGVNLSNMKESIFAARYLIDPVPGLMVVFPSWLNHLVHPFFGKGERISVAFNVQTSEVPSPATLS